MARGSNAGDCVQTPSTPASEKRTGAASATSDAKRSGWTDAWIVASVPPMQ
jgi:hypothetical protein